MNKLILLHGTGNDWRGNWIPFVKDQLEKRGWEVFAPSLPDSDYPDGQKWTDYVIKNVPFSIDADTTIVSHSSGAALIPQLLQLLPPATKIKKAILVSGFHTDLGWEKLKDLHNIPIDYDVVAKKSQEFILIYSDNDPYVPAAEVEWLAQKLHGQLKLIPGQGHFNLEASPKYKEFPKLMALILHDRQLTLGGVYRHFKGKLYLVREIVKDSETQADMVLYQPLYRDPRGSVINSYVRSLDMFLSEVDHAKYPDVAQKYRFEELPNFPH